MLDPAVEAIICARGGYGSMRLLDELPWDAFAVRPKRIVGFSDVTALHLELNARGIASVHGPNVTGLGRSIAPLERVSLIAALEDGPLPSWTDLEILASGGGGEARGPVFGGNLALVEAMASAGRLSLPEGCILLLEEVTERPYRVDRMLTSLLLGGHLARASAIVFGAFTQCDPGPDGITIDHVLRDRTCHLRIPIVARGPFGHGSPNHAFVLGRQAHLLGDRLDWE
jgi:muramoyltetrapeptide carboxypeptidase